MKKLFAKPIKEKIIEELKSYIKINHLDNMDMAIITSGTDDASKVYIKQKVKLAKSLEINPIVIDLNEGYKFEGEIINNNSSTEDLLLLIKDLASDKIPMMIQMPLQNDMDDERLLDAIPPELDIDGLTKSNLGGVLLDGINYKGNIACTPKGIIDLLDGYDINLEAKNVLIIGRSEIVGKPLIGLLLSKNASVKIDHSKTQAATLKEDLANSDIIITQVGIPNFFGVNNIKNDAIVIDVSMNRDINNKLCGDFNTYGVENTSIEYTPVPGGVGPMTVTELIKNVIYDNNEN